MDTRRSTIQGDGFELGLIAVGGVVVGLGVVTWLGARLGVLLTGGEVRGGLSDWLAIALRLVRGIPPRSAWGEHAERLPSAPLYWVTTAIAFVGVGAVATGLWWLWRRLARPDDRVRFGQRTDARQATERDVRPLIVSHVVPPTGRMLLGRIANGGQLLATEDRQRHALAGRVARRQGNRGSVALIGPTGSGKTALAISAIATWDGPVVAVSVKRDLYDATVKARAIRGDVAVFDPGGVTGLPTARWSPLEATTSSSGALRTGRALAQAIPKGSVTNADYWAEHGEGLLGAFMCVAGLSRLLKNDDGTLMFRPAGMEQVASWVRTLATATDPTIHDIIEKALDEKHPIEVQLLGRHASTTFTGIGREDEKIRSSVYSTAVLALKPWLEPAVAHSASDNPHKFYSGGEVLNHRPRFVDLDWLMAGDDGHANTLYLSAPSAEFERLSPVLGGLLADLKDTIHAWDIARRKLEKPLLIVIDEAAHLQLGWLPTEVSTIAALGAFFVTCWQNLAQINHRYDSLADSVLSGHRTKCFFAGVDDLTTMKYVTTMLGHEQVTRRGWSQDVPSAWGNRQGGRRSVSESTQREEFAPAHTLRQMFPGEAVLIHGTLPPVHLDAVRYWEEPDLASLVGELADDRQPPTCPLTNEATAGGPHPAIDAETIRAAKAQLPKANRPPSDTTSAKPHHDRKSDPNQPSFFDGYEQTRQVEEPTTGRCHSCADALGPGEGKEYIDRVGDRHIVCAPNCSERRDFLRLNQVHDRG